ncbi:MAG: pyridoxamine 5'-phosphate oxidase [Chitinophagaceae bacterium]|nr:pyridoxamine 5'-phosphate oxidase [Chitinophagaceae bacterium]
MLDLIADMRKDYKLRSFQESDADTDAIKQFEKWWQEATDSEITEVNAMTLATSSSDGIPSARIVLLKGFSKNGFSFFTNYNSFKAQQLEENPRACLVFFWKELERQVRVTGVIQRLSAAENDEYFNSRPEGSRIGAIASPQSQVIPAREWLDKEANSVTKKYEGSIIPRPDYWGGYLVRPITVEFWQGRSGRLHDRLQYTLEEDGGWKIERLAP